MTEQDKRVFPVVYSFEGRPSDDNSTFLVEGTGFDGSPVRFAIPVDNIQHFIAFLLVWVRTLSDAVDKQPEGSEFDGRIPIPATSIAVGHPNGNEAYIGISVGRAELVFSLPAASLGSIGQSFMIAGTPSNAVVS
jgi:hypothetical protein